MFVCMNVYSFICTFIYFLDYVNSRRGVLWSVLCLSTQPPSYLCSAAVLDVIVGAYKEVNKCVMLRGFISGRCCVSA